MIVKIIILIYIVISSAINHRYLAFVNDTPIKVLMLISIVLISFIDLQLAILITVAFLIMLINVYKLQLGPIKRKSAVVTSEEQNKKVLAEVVKQEVKPNPEIVSHEGRRMLERFTEDDVHQTISTFPEPYCPGVGQEVQDISQHMFSISTDDRVKPFEEYIRKLSPEQGLHAIQDNTVV